MHVYKSIHRYVYRYIVRLASVGAEFESRVAQFKIAVSETQARHVHIHLYIYMYTDLYIGMCIGI